MREATQQLFAPIMMNDRLAHHGAQARHPVREPSGNGAAMQREIRASTSAGHASSLFFVHETFYHAQRPARKAPPLAQTRGLVAPPRDPHVIALATIVEGRDGHAEFV